MVCPLSSILPLPRCLLLPQSTTLDIRLMASRTLKNGRGRLTSSSIHLSTGRPRLVEHGRSETASLVGDSQGNHTRQGAVPKWVYPDYKHQIRMYTIIRSTPSSIVFKIHQCYHHSDNDNDNDNDKEDSNRSYIINTIHHLQKEVKNVYEQNSEIATSNQKPDSRVGKRRKGL